jgi:hypothetical protein
MGENIMGGDIGGELDKLGNKLAEIFTDTVRAPAQAVTAAGYTLAVSGGDVSMAIEAGREAYDDASKSGAERREEANARYGQDWKGDPLPRNVEVKSPQEAASDVMARMKNDELVTKFNQNLGDNISPDPAAGAQQIADAALTTANQAMEAGMDPKEVHWMLKHAESEIKRMDAPNEDALKEQLDAAQSVVKDGGIPEAPQAAAAAEPMTPSVEQPAVTAPKGMGMGN